jgi:hypothetical protein
VRPEIEPSEGVHFVPSLIRQLISGLEFPVCNPGQLPCDHVFPAGSCLRAQLAVAYQPVSETGRLIG